MCNGSPFDAAGIPLADGRFLVLDKAKIGAAITGRIIESANPEDTILKLSEKGWGLSLADLQVTRR